MKMRILVPMMALAGCFALIQADGEAKARATLMCRMQNGSMQPASAQNGAPQIVTVTGGTYSSQNTANNSAVQAWSSAAMAFGGQYANWSNARQKNINCWSTKPNFQYLYTCRATGQPCG